jgi:hypothetical protein
MIVFMKNTTLSPQLISRIVGKTQVKKGNSYKSGLKGQGQRSHEGYSVHQGVEGVIVNYTPSTGSAWHNLFLARRETALTTIASALIAEGFNLSESTIYPGAIVVEVAA